MKKLNYLIAFCLISCSFAFAQQISLQPGLKLVYDVQGSSSNYQYIAVIKEVSEKGVLFNWEMTDPKNIKGQIFIPKNSLDTAGGITYGLYEHEGVDTFKNRTTMIFPRRTYHQLISKEKVTFTCDVCFRLVTIPKIESVKFETNMDRKPYSLSAIEGSGEYSTGKFTILADEKFPLILEYNGTFHIKLKEILFGQK